MTKVFIAHSDVIDGVTSTYITTAEGVVTTGNGAVTFTTLYDALESASGNIVLDGKPFDKLVDAPPKIVSARQARQALIELDLDETAEAFIAGIADPKLRKTVKNWYDNSGEWEIDNAVLREYAAALNIDRYDFFKLAAKL